MVSMTIHMNALGIGMAKQKDFTTGTNSWQLDSNMYRNSFDPRWFECRQIDQERFSWVTLGRPREINLITKGPALCVASIAIPEGFRNGINYNKCFRGPALGSKGVSNSGYILHSKLISFWTSSAFNRDCRHIPECHPIQYIDIVETAVFFHMTPTHHHESQKAGLKLLAL